jgi:colanic acid biosynthesis glycosyl transferase WcaI
VRILVVTQYFWPEDFRINELVAELVGRGNQVTVLTGIPNYPTGDVFPEFRKDRARFDEYHGARIERVPIVTRGRGRVRLLLNYLSYAVSATVLGKRRLRDAEFDAIFVFEPSPITVGIPAIFLRATRGWPVAFWVLDQWPETLSAVGALRSEWGLRAVGRLVAFIYSRCDLVLTQSRSLVEVARRYAGRTPVRYFPNWSESDYSAESVTPAPEVPIDKDAFNILFAGNVGESQDFPAILDAADRLKDDPRIRWLIVGDGRAQPWVQAEVARRGLDRRVVLLGRFPQGRMPSFYQHADALLVSLRAQPVFSLTVPGKVQSYLAFGLPILGMLDGEGARVIEEAKAGLTAPAGDSRNLAECVRRMAALPKSQRAAMGASGRAYAKREFDRDSLIRSLEAMLAQLRQRRASTPV